MLLCPWFSRQEYWSGSSCPPPGDLPNPGVKPMSPSSPLLAVGLFTTETPGKSLFLRDKGYFHLIFKTVNGLHKALFNKNKIFQHILHSIQWWHRWLEWGRKRQTRQRGQEPEKKKKEINRRKGKKEKNKRTLQKKIFEKEKRSVPLSQLELSMWWPQVGSWNSLDYWAIDPRNAVSKRDKIRLAGWSPSACPWLFLVPGKSFSYTQNPEVREDKGYEGRSLKAHRNCPGNAGLRLAKTLCSQYRGPGFHPWSGN